MVSMKKVMFYMILSSLLVVFIAFNKSLVPKKSFDPIKNTGFAIVELFTSEGCSSCPSADEILQRLANIKDNLIVLSFHVDYWNKLGWKDPYSDAAYSQRQLAYASTKLGDGVYTPQTIVNGTVHLVGSQEKQLTNSIKNYLDAFPSKKINIIAKQGKDKVTVSYTAELASDEILNVALIQKKSSEKVTSGENRGLQLLHVNIVRAFTSTSENNGDLTLNFPKGLGANDCLVGAYIQQKVAIKVMGISGYTFIN